MYVISGIVKVLAVSVSLKRQIPTRPRLLCSSYPSGTATDRVGYFGTVLNVRVLYLFEIPEEYAPKWEFLAKFTLLATEVSAILKTGNERYWPYVRFWLQIGFSIPVSKSFGAVLKVRSAIRFEIPTDDVPEGAVYDRV